MFLKKSLGVPGQQRSVQPRSPGTGAPHLSHVAKIVTQIPGAAEAPDLFRDALYPFCKQAMLRRRRWAPAARTPPGQEEPRGPRYLRLRPANFARRRPRSGRAAPGLGSGRASPARPVPWHRARSPPLPPLTSAAARREGATEGGGAAPLLPDRGERGATPPEPRGSPDASVPQPVRPSVSLSVRPSVRARPGPARGLRWGAGRGRRAGGACALPGTGRARHLWRRPGREGRARRRSFSAEASGAGRVLRQPKGSACPGRAQPAGRGHLSAPQAAQPRPRGDSRQKQSPNSGWNPAVSPAGLPPSASGRQGLLFVPQIHTNLWRASQLCQPTCEGFKTIAATPQFCFVKCRTVS